VDKVIALKCVAPAEASPGRETAVSEINRKTRVKHNRILTIVLAVLIDPRVAFFTRTGI
jgi:hypothetical protein